MKYIVTVGGQRLEVDTEGDTMRIDGQTVPARLAEVEGTPVKVLMVGDRVHRVVAERGVARGQYTLWIDGHRYETEALDERMRAIRDLSGASARASGPAPLVAPMPGLIVRVGVEVGQSVQVGQPVVVMEAMKMENELRSQSQGTVSAVRVQPGDAVEKGAVLVELS
ncbi:MAG: biotin/lipoyl-containing protein [Gemmatimonadaceae bacterium]